MCIRDRDNPEAKYIIIDSSTISDIDSTGLHLLDNIDKDFSERGIELHLCGTIGVVRDALHLSGLMTEPNKHHVTIHDAILSIKDGTLENEANVHVPLQTNIK